MARTESKTPIWGVIAVLALLAVGANFLLRILSDPASGMDFSIYRLGAMTIFDNEGFTQDLYSPTLNDHGVIKPPFTYPPFAAMLFLPFAFMPLVVGKVLMVLGSVVVAWWLSTVIYNYVNARGRELPLQRYFGRVGTYRRADPSGGCGGSLAAHHRPDSDQPVHYRADSGRFCASGDPRAARRADRHCRRREAHSARVRPHPAGAPRLEGHRNPGCDLLRHDCAGLHSDAQGGTGILVLGADEPFARGRPELCG